MKNQKPPFTIIQRLPLCPLISSVNLRGSATLPSFLPEVSMKPKVSLFRPDPQDTNCLTCGKPILITADRHYILWCPSHTRSRQSNNKSNGRYRRQCAKCYDEAHQRPYERRHNTDSHIATVTTDRTLA